MKLHEISPAKGSRKAKKRIGRGPGSGTGKTAGRGQNGQRSRSGFSQRLGFEGGQMPLIRRVPKRGFTSLFRVSYTPVNLRQLEDFDGEITPDLLVEHGLVRKGALVKILAEGEVTKGLRITAHKFSKTARAKIEAAGGQCEELGP